MDINNLDIASIGIEIDSTSAKQQGPQVKSVFDSIDQSITRMLADLAKLGPGVADFMRKFMEVRKIQEELRLANQRVQDLRDSVKKMADFASPSIEKLRLVVAKLDAQFAQAKRSAELWGEVTKARFAAARQEAENYYRSLLQIQNFKFVRPDAGALQTGGTAFPTDLSGFIGAQLRGGITTKPLTAGGQYEIAMQRLGNVMLTAASASNSLSTSVQNTDAVMGRSVLVAILQGTIIRRTFFEALRLIQEGFAEVVQSEREFANVNMLLGEDQSINKVREQVIGLGAEYGKTSDLAHGYYEVLKAGIDQKDALDALTSSVKAARAGIGSTEDAIQAGTTVMDAFGLKSSDLTRIYDEMFQTVAKGHITIPQLAKDLGGISELAASSGLKMEEMFAAISASSETLGPQRAISGLRAALKDIEEPSETTQRLARQLGIEFNETGLRAKGLGGFLDEVYQKTGGNVSTIGKLFAGTQALATVLSLTGNRAQVFSSDLTSMSIAAGKVDEAFKKEQQSIGAQFDQFTANIEKSLTILSGPFITVLSSVLAFINQYPGAFSATTVAITSATIAFAAFNLQAMIASGEGGSRLLSVLMQVRLYFMGVGEAAEMSAGAMALTAGVYGLVIAGVAAIGYGIYKLIQNYNELHIASENEITSLQKQINILQSANNDLKGITVGTKSLADSNVDLKNAYDLLDPASRQRINSAHDQTEALKLLNEELAKELALRKQEQLVQGGDVISGFQKSYQQEKQIINELEQHKRDVENYQPVGLLRYDKNTGLPFDELQQQVTRITEKSLELEKQTESLRQKILLLTGGTKEGARQFFDLQTTLGNTKGNFDQFYAALTETGNRYNFFTGQMDAGTNAIDNQANAVQNLDQKIRGLMAGDVARRIQSRTDEAIQWRLTHPEYGQTTQQMVRDLMKEPQFSEDVKLQRQLDQDRQAVQNATGLNKSGGLRKTKSTATSEVPFADLRKEYDELSDAVNNYGKVSDLEKVKQEIIKDGFKEMAKEIKAMDEAKKKAFGSEAENDLSKFIQQVDKAHPGFAKLAQGVLDFTLQLDGMKRHDEGLKSLAELTAQAKDSLDQLGVKTKEMTLLEDARKVVLKSLTDEQQRAAAGLPLFEFLEKFAPTDMRNFITQLQQVGHALDVIAQNDKAQQTFERFQSEIEQKFPKKDESSFVDTIRAKLRRDRTLTGEQKDSILDYAQQAQDAINADKAQQDFNKTQDQYKNLLIEIEEQRKRSLNLTYAQQVALKLEKSEYDDLSQAQKDSLIAEAQRVDQFTKLHKAIGDFQKDFQSSLTDALTRGPEARFKHLLESFRSTLAQLFSEWITSKFFRAIMNFLDPTYAGAGTGSGNGAGSGSNSGGARRTSSSGGFSSIFPNLAHSAVSSITNPSGGSSSGTFSVSPVEAGGTGFSGLSSLAPQGISTLAKKIPGLRGLFPGNAASKTLTNSDFQNLSPNTFNLDVGPADMKANIPLVGQGSELAGLGSAGVLAGGSILGAFAGGNSPIGQTLGMAGGTLGAGALAATGIFGSGLSAALPALFSNPITAIVAGGLIGGALLAGWLSNGVQRAIKQAVSTTYPILDVKDNNLLTSIKQVGEQTFGQGQAGNHVNDIIHLQNVKQMLTAYALQTGQVNNELVRTYVGTNPNSTANNITRMGDLPTRAEGGTAFGGQGVIVHDSNVPEVFIPRGSGYIHRDAGIFFNHAANRGNSTSSPNNDNGMKIIHRMTMQMMSEVNKVLNRLKEVNPNTFMQFVDDDIVSGKAVDGFNNNEGHSYQLARLVGN